MFLLINNLIEKKMTRRASLNLADSYIVRLTFSDPKSDQRWKKQFCHKKLSVALFANISWSVLALGSSKSELYQVRHVFSKLSFLIVEFALCQDPSDYLGCLVNRKSGASLPHWLTSKWCKPPGPHWGLLRPPKKCKKQQSKHASAIFANLMQYYVDSRCI